MTESSLAYLSDRLDQAGSLQVPVGRTGVMYGRASRHRRRTTSILGLSSDTFVRNVTVITARYAIDAVVDSSVCCPSSARIVRPVVIYRKLSKIEPQLLRNTIKKLDVGIAYSVATSMTLP